MADDCPTEAQLKALRVVDLKEKLTSLGLTTSGLKADLVSRLNEYYETQRNSGGAEVVEGQYDQAAEAEAANLAAVQEAEAQRLAAEQEAQRLAAEQAAEAQRLAAEQAAEAQRLAAEQAAEAQRLAAEQEAQQAAEAQRLAAEQEAQRLAAEQAAEAQRLAAEQAAEAQRLAAEQAAEAERQAAVEAERQAAEAQRLAAEQAAEAERQAAVEAERQAAEEAERQRVQAEQAAEAQRLAAEQEAQRLAAEQAAEAERQAAEEAERQRLEAERQAAEAQRLAAEQEAQRLAAEQEAEAQRLAAEQEAQKLAAEQAAEAERQAAKEAERQRQEAERQEAEEAERQRQEAERQAAEEAERQKQEAERQAAEEAERKAAEEAERQKQEAERQAALEDDKMEESEYGGGSSEYSSAVPVEEPPCVEKHVAPLGGQEEEPAQTSSKFSIKPQNVPNFPSLPSAVGSEDFEAEGDSFKPRGQQPAQSQAKQSQPPVVAENQNGDAAKGGNKNNKKKKKKKRNRPEEWARQAAEAERRKREEEERKENEGKDPQDEIVYVQEDIDLEPTDPMYRMFAKIFDNFKIKEGDEEDKKEEADTNQYNKELKKVPKLLEADDLIEEKEDDEDDDKPKLSKRKLKKLNRLSVAELKQLVTRPDVVEMHDVTARDPRLLVHLKSTRNTVPVPRHWCFKRKYLQGKRGIEKPAFQLPEFIRKTGIMEMRAALQDKEDAKNMKSKMREKVRPKMGKIDIDYQKLHDAFFKWQTKPRMTHHGDLYYEGKEFEIRLKEKKPGDLSDDLRTALGMPVGPNAHKVPPPWLIAMQRYGPPPTYPNLKIPGLNAPIPEGCTFGYHAGGWGKPPVDESGKPLYGDVFGTSDSAFAQEMPTEEVDNTLWGELESESEEEESESEDEEEEGEEGEGKEGEEEGLKTPVIDAGSETPSGMSSVGGPSIMGQETPEFVELRKKRIEAEMEQGGETPNLYTILPEKRNERIGGSMMGSTHTYDVAGAKKGYNESSGVELNLAPEEVDLMDSEAMQAKAEAALRASQANLAKEDLSDMVAEHAARQTSKRKRQAGKEKEGEKAGPGGKAAKFKF